VARRAPSFFGLEPASPRSTSAARGSSRKRGTRCEIEVRRALREIGVTYSLRNKGLPGSPDLVFPRERVVVFCDGDFWHGRDLEKRLNRLRAGHNASYWIAKITGNVQRDARNRRALEELGWTVLRFWEGDIARAPDRIANRIARELRRANRR
jgi:DNA mismatch endonuclease (patch repair protein)